MKETINCKYDGWELSPVQYYQNGVNVTRQVGEGSPLPFSLMIYSVTESTPKIARTASKQSIKVCAYGKA